MQEQHHAGPQTRRGFLATMTLVLGAIPGLGGLFVALRSGLSPAGGTRPARIPLCRLDEVPEQGVKMVAVGYQLRSGPVVEGVAKVVFVTRHPESKEILALSGECTHLGCPVQDRTLKTEAGVDAPLTCPCHGGMFSQTGEVLAGPPERPLRRLQLDTLPAEPSGMLHLLEV